MTSPTSMTFCHSGGADAAYRIVLAGEGVPGAERGQPAHGGLDPVGVDLA
ncbi:hypothetical protein [Micromonospora sp. NPDC049799]